MACEKPHSNCSAMYHSYTVTPPCFPLYRNQSGGFVMVFTTIGGGFILHVIYNCGMLINSGMLTIGQTSALAGYLLLSGASYQGLISAYGEIQKALGACDRIVTLMEDATDASSPSLSPPTSSRAHPLVFSGSSISSAPSATLRDVRFKYSPCAPLVLDGFSMFVPSGAKQSIVGLSGSGDKEAEREQRLQCVE